MERRKIKWVFFGILVVVVLLSVSHPLPRQKARALRIHAVNNIPSFSVTITNSMALPGPAK